MTKPFAFRDVHEWTPEYISAKPLLKDMEGLYEERPLFRRGNDSIVFALEHHAQNSRGGYIVTIKGKTMSFHQLEDAINFFNIHDK